MIELKTGEDSIFVNENEISSMYRCRGSIGAYSSYTVLIMKNGTRHEVSEEPQNIQKAIQAEKKGEAQ